MEDLEDELLFDETIHKGQPFEENQCLIDVRLSIRDAGAVNYCAKCCIRYHGKSLIILQQFSYISLDTFLGGGEGCLLLVALDEVFASTTFLAWHYCTRIPYPLYNS